MKLTKRQLAIPLLCFLLLNCALKAESQTTLKEAFAGKFLIGTAMNLNEIWEKDTLAVKVITQQFDAIVAENCMKSMYLQPKEGEFDFKDADRFVAFGEQNHLWMTGHCLIWHSQAPSWFFTDKDGNAVSRDTLIARMRNHITSVVGRYKGRIKGWDVVNEALNDDGTYRNSKFYEIVGEDFIPLAFKFAHEADPDAELYYNDYNEWRPEKRDAIVKLVKKLKDAGLRIDAVGMQGHVGMDYPDLGDYKAAIDAYAAAGVKVMVTELDLSALPSPRRNVGANVSDIEAYRNEMNPYTGGLPDSVATAWTNRMTALFKLFIDNKDKMERVTLWGVTDGQSWKNDFPMRGRTDYPLLFDRNYQPKTIVSTIIQEAEKQ